MDTHYPYTIPYGLTTQMRYYTSVHSETKSSGL